MGVKPVRSTPGTYHVPRAVEAKTAYDWIVRSSPVSSLLTLLSVRCGEVLIHRMREEALGARLAG